MVELEQLSFKADTSELNNALTAVNALVKSLGALATAQEQETKTSLANAKAKDTEIKASEASAKAAEKEAKAKESLISSGMTWKKFTSERMSDYMKSEGSHADAMKRLSTEWKELKNTLVAVEAAQNSSGKSTRTLSSQLEDQNKVLQRNLDIYDFMVQGYSKGQASQLAAAKSTGALTDELLSLGKVLQDQRKLMGGDPFDKSMSGIVGLKNQYGELREAIRQYNSGTELSRNQTRDLARDKERIIEAMKAEGKTFSEIKAAIKAYNQEYIDTANNVNNILKQEREIERQYRESANAIRNLTKEEERMTSVVATLTTGTDANARLSEKAAIAIANYERNLKLAGITGEQAAVKLAKYKAQQDAVMKAEQQRTEQYLTRAIIPQFSDIFVGLTTGQSPFTVMLQQLPQIQDLFTLTGVKAKDTVNVLSNAATEMFTRLKDTFAAVGAGILGMFSNMGRAVTSFAGQVTGTAPLLEKLRESIVANAGEGSALIRVFDGLSKSINILTGLAVGGLVVGLGLVAAGFVSVIKEQDRLAVSMAQFGQGMGVSYESAVAMTNSLKDVGITSATASEALIAMSKTGKFTADQFSMVAIAASDMKKYAGISVEDTVKSFEKMADDPVKALIEVAKTTGLVSIETIKLVEDFKEQGKETEAVALAMQTLASVNKQQIETMKQDLSGFAMFMKTLGSEIGSFFDNVFKELWTKSSPLEQINKQIGKIQYNLKLADLLGDDNSKQRNLAILKTLQDQYAEIVKANNAKDEAAAKDKEQLKIHEEINNMRDKSVEGLDKYNKQMQKLTNMYAKARDDDKAAIQEQMQFETKKYKEWLKREEKKNKPKKDPEAAKIENYYDRIIQGARDADEATQGVVDQLNKYEVKLNQIQNDEYFKKQSKARQNEIIALYEQAAKQEDINKSKELSLKLLGQEVGLGADYYKQLALIDKYQSKGIIDLEKANKLKEALYNNTQQGKDLKNINESYRNYLDQLSREAEQLQTNRDMIFKTNAEQEIANNLLSTRIKMMEAANKLQQDLAKINNSSLSPEQKKTESDKATNNYFKAVENINFDAQTKALSQFSDEWKLLTERVNLFGTELGSVFGGFGKSVGVAINAFAKLGANLEMNQRQYEAMREEVQKGSKTQTNLAKLSKKQQIDEIGMYAEVAGAAKGMFGQKTAAAKAFGAIEKVLHVARIGMMITEMATSKTSVFATLADNATKMASSVATMVVDGTAAVVKTIASLPFPLNLAAGAAVSAVIAGLIGSVGGSFNSSISGSAPTYNTGTGTVFGDSSAKSESISKSLELLQEANSLTQKYSPQMLLHLRNIDESIGGLVNLMIRTGNLDASAAGVNVGTKTGGGILTSAVNSVSDALSKIPLVGGIAGGIIGKIGGAILGGIFGKTSTSITGQGITGNAQSLGDILSGQYQAQYFTDVKTTKKSWFSSKTSYSTRLSDADAELEQQITAVFKGVYDSVLAGAELLGKSESEITNTLNNFVVDIGKVNLSGTAEEMQKALTAAFGAASDNIAKAVVPGLEQFQKVGEGYFETLIRVSSELEKTNSWFDMLGKNLLSLGVSGIAANESLMNLFGGVSNLDSALSEYYDNFYSEQEKLQKKTEQLTAVFGNLGLQLPTTLEGYRDIVNAQDLTTKSGQEAFYTLIQVSGAFKEVAESSGLLQKSIQEYLNILENQVKTNEQIANSIYDYNNQSEQLAAKYSDLITGAKGASSAVYRLTVSSMHPLEKAAYDSTVALQALIDSYQAQNQMIESTYSTLNKAITDQISAYKETFSVTDNALANLQKAVDAEKEVINTRIKTLETLRDGFSDLFDFLKEQVDELRNSSEAVQAINALSAKEIIKKALNGDLTDISSVKNASSVLKTSVTSGSYASLVDQQRAYLTLANELEAVQKVATVQKTTAQLQLDSLNAQLVNLDLIVENAQKQLNTLRGIDNGVEDVYTTVSKFYKAVREESTAREQISVLQQQLGVATQQYNALLQLNTSITNLEAALAAWQKVVNGGTIPTPNTPSGNTPSGNTPSGNTPIPDSNIASTINDIYKNLFGREADVAGLKYYAQEYASGKISADKLVSTIAGGAQGSDLIYLTRGYADGGFTGYGGINEPAGIVHKGEYVLNQQDVKSLGGPGNISQMLTYSSFSGNNQETISELKALREEVSLLRAEARATAVHTSKIAKLQDRNNELDTVKVTIVKNLTVP